MCFGLGLFFAFFVVVGCGGVFFCLGFFVCFCFFFSWDLFLGKNNQVSYISKCKIHVNLKIRGLLSYLLKVNFLFHMDFDRRRFKKKQLIQIVISGTGMEQESSTKAWSRSPGWCCTGGALGDQGTVPIDLKKVGKAGSSESAPPKWRRWIRSRGAAG